MCIVKKRSKIDLQRYDIGLRHNGPVYRLSNHESDTIISNKSLILVSGFGGHSGIHYYCRSKVLLSLCGSSI